MSLLEDNSTQRIVVLSGPASHWVLFCRERFVKKAQRAEQRPHSGNHLLSRIFWDVAKGTVQVFFPTKTLLRVSYTGTTVQTKTSAHHSYGSASEVTAGGQ